MQTCVLLLAHSRRQPSLPVIRNSALYLEIPSFEIRPRNRLSLLGSSWFSSLSSEISVVVPYSKPQLLRPTHHQLLSSKLACHSESDNICNLKKVSLNKSPCCPAHITWTNSHPIVSILNVQETHSLKILGPPFKTIRCRNMQGNNLKPETVTNLLHVKFSGTRIVQFL
jgi:hypothetical protein